MAFWFVTAVVVVGLVVLAALSRIRIRVRYSHSGHHDHLVIIVRALYGAAGFEMDIPAIMIRSWHLVYRQELSANIGKRPVKKKARWKTGPGLLIRLWKLYRKNRQFHVWMLQTLRRVECTRFRMDFRVGTGDAPSTAVLSGLLWSVYGCAIGMAAHLMKLQAQPHGGVAPVYDGTEFSVVCEADMQIRFGTAFLCILKLGTRSIRIGRSLGYWRRSLAGS